MNKETDYKNEVVKRLGGFDSYMNNIMRDWNGVGFGVGVVVGDELVFARGYGYRDYDKKLPVTPKTLFLIGSNTKSFAAVSAGLLVDAGSLNWDGPIASFVSGIKFYDDDMNRSITLRDLLAHRTGVPRYEPVWLHRDISSRELFDLLKYLKPNPGEFRHVLRYNNIMYNAVGHIISLKTGDSWENYTKANLLAPLKMNSTVFSVEDMLEFPDHGVAYSEDIGTKKLSQMQYLRHSEGTVPAGGMISNVEDLSHWVIALINDGNYGGKKVIPASVIKITREPSMTLSNAGVETNGWSELLNPEQGIGFRIASYRGHRLVYHGGTTPGFYSQVSYMPEDRIGVIFWGIGKHLVRMIDPITYNIYEMALGMNVTPWNERMLVEQKKFNDREKSRLAEKSKDRILGTKPSHPMRDYAGIYHNEIYGDILVRVNSGALEFEFRGLKAKLVHYHYDRFDAADRHEYLEYSCTFLMNRHGFIDRLVMPLQGEEVEFTRRLKN